MGTEENSMSAKHRRSVREFKPEKPVDPTPAEGETTMLQFDFHAIPRTDRYKLLTGLVVPRPIALVTTLSKHGVANAAPFSFFNVFSDDPGIVVLGISDRPDGSQKDTVRNARETGWFAVNMVDENLAIAMNECAVDFPAATSEPDVLGLKLVAGTHTPVPHLAVAPAVLECRKMMMINIGPGRELVIGEVLGIQVREGIVDPHTLRVNFDTYQPIGRLAGSHYTRRHDRFSMVHTSFAEWSGRIGNGASEKVDQSMRREDPIGDHAS
jgi:flavin reductase (DIM6/NTAB) family NADH-FMN oxidoreductase RutF